MESATPMFEDQDAQAVDAIKSGDLERFRELIERYEQKVYAVAWCRLGDADLAEEATQEAFIKGFRHLALLGQGKKFAAWITAIARHVAINLGLRHRSELKKRERWSLAQSEAWTTSAPDQPQDDEPVSAETLRATLAEIPSHHRECLVLFYLEGKSVAEAAVTLGLSENAFKTRLHRARTVMRERLETKLEDSLTQLRPRHALAPAIMTVLAAQPLQVAAAASGGTAVLAKLVSATGKWLPFQWITLSLLPFVAMLPGLLLGYWAGRLDQRNYREPEGFRARIYGAALKQALILTPILFVGIVFFAQWTKARWNEAVFFQIFGLLFLPWLYQSLRLLAINRNRFLLYNQAAVAIQVLGFVGIGFLNLPLWTMMYFQGAFFFLLACSFRYQPLRMDYNLFLRVAQNMLPSGSEDHGSDRIPAPQWSREQLFAFARFLGERFIICDFRENKAGLHLRLPPVKPNMRDNFFPIIWFKRSFLTMKSDGEVKATLGEKDRRQLTSVLNRSIDSEQGLENSVARAVQSSFQAFQTGALRQAELALGQQPDEAIFRELP